MYINAMFSYVYIQENPVFEHKYAPMSSVI